MYRKIYKKDSEESQNDLCKSVSHRTIIWQQMMSDLVCQLQQIMFLIEQTLFALYTLSV